MEPAPAGGSGASAWASARSEEAEARAGARRLVTVPVEKHAAANAARPGPGRQALSRPMAPEGRADNGRLRPLLRPGGRGWGRGSGLPRLLWRKFPYSPVIVL